MNDLPHDAIRMFVHTGFTTQERAVAEWHRAEPTFAVPRQQGDHAGAFDDLLLRQHWCNFQLWHVEDRARRRDAEPGVIVECKSAIDILNQERNDLVEALDTYLVRLLVPLLPEPAAGRPRYHSETLGMILDRGSILALKIFHMREQAVRSGVPEEHRTVCERKLAVLCEQCADLLQSAEDLVGEYISGAKRPKVYYQFKMYNDPTLNPELYGDRPEP